MVKCLDQGCRQQIVTWLIFKPLPSVLEVVALPLVHFSKDGSDTIRKLAGETHSTASRVGFPGQENHDLGM
jgi:hypothetical protein